MERKKIEDVGEYFGENYIKINGKGVKASEILTEYLYYMNNGYTVTVDDISSYLNCNQAHFLKYYRDSIKHIRINTMVRHLAAESENYNFDLGEYARYFNKRILYSKDSFEEFITNECKREMMYYPLSIRELGYEPGTKGELLEIQAYYNMISYQLFKECKEPKLIPLGYMLERIHSLKTIKNALNLKYDVDLYRRIDKYAVNKIRLGNLVRYDIEDFKGDVVRVNYNAYIELGKEKIIAKMLGV